MVNPSSGVVLVLGSGGRPYREYLLRGLAQRSALWLVDERPPTWQRPYLVGSSVVAPLDEERAVPDRQGLLDVALAVAHEHQVAGVVTYDELLVTAAAAIAETLGVPGLSAAGAENCRDKARTRAVLTAAGLPQPRYALVRDLADAVTAAGRLGYPVVAKPRGMGASVGVVRVRCATELADAVAVVDRAR